MNIRDAELQSFEVLVIDDADLAVLVVERCWRALCVR